MATAPSVATAHRMAPARRAGNPLQGTERGKSGRFRTFQNSSALRKDRGMATMQECAAAGRHGRLLPAADLGRAGMNTDSARCAGELALDARPSRRWQDVVLVAQQDLAAALAGAVADGRLNRHTYQHWLATESAVCRINA